MSEPIEHRGAANDESEEVVRTAPGGEVVLIRPKIRITGAGMTDEKGAAVYLGKSVRTLQRWRQQKCGPVYHEQHGTIWYRVSDLDAYLALWRVDPLAS